jgi:hypothetical protein
MEAEMLMNKRALEKLSLKSRSNDEIHDKLVKLMRKHLDSIFKIITKLEPKDRIKYINEYDEYIKEFHKLHS